MDTRPALCVLSVLVVCVMCAQDQNSANNDGRMTRRWTPWSFPNPYNATDKGCMRGGKVSSVCDPDEILSIEQADQLDGEIQRLRDETNCPCSQDSCRRNPAGYRVSIAIMDEMHDSYEGERSTEDKMEWSLSEAHLFAHTLLNSWNAGQCTEDILILYSQKNNVIYTVTNQISRKVLSNSKVGQIASRVRYNFAPHRDVYLGLKQMIEYYKQVFNGVYQTNVKQPEVNKPQDPQAQISRNGQERLSLYKTLLLTSLAVILLSIGW